VTLADLVAAYGYPVVFLGTMLEGETILLLAGFAAHRGHLELPLVLAWATAGATVGDQAWFLVGRLWGAKLVARYPRLQGGVQRVVPKLDRYGVGFVVLDRFLTGLRTAGPIAVGMTRMHWLTFALANAFGAVLWALAIGSLGYFVGEGVERVLGNVRHAEEAVLAAAILAVATYALWRRLRARRLAQRTAPRP
jgi:membrane protein DedA with SNARE-associated domain